MAKCAIILVAFLNFFSNYVEAVHLLPSSPTLLPIVKKLTVSNNYKSLNVDHSNPNDSRSIQYALNQIGEGGEIILDSDNTYFISNRLFIPNNVRLRGKFKEGSEFLNQKITVTNDFPADRSMIILKSGGSLIGLNLDGNNIAWRIIRLSENGQNYLISQNTLVNTKHDTGYLPEHNSILGGSNQHVDIIFARKSSFIEVSNNIIIRAGLKAGIGKENNPFEWAAIGAGITAYNCENLIIENNVIEETVTAGIAIAGSKIVSINNNNIDYTGRNIEWFDGEYGKGLGDGITGYHNHVFINPTPTASFPLNWTISNNIISHSGNHGIHIGGKAITLENNFTEKSWQTGLYLGDQRQASDLLPDVQTECLSDVIVGNLGVRSSGYQGIDQFYYNTSVVPVNPRETANVYLRSYSNLVDTIIFLDLDLDGETFYDDENIACDIH